MMGLGQGWRVGVGVGWRRQGFSVSDMFDVFHWIIKAGLNSMKRYRAQHYGGRITDQSSFRSPRKQTMYVYVSQ